MHMAVPAPSDPAAVDALHAAYGRLRREIGKVIVGQDEVVRGVIVCLLAQGHCLLIGVPGLAKTLLIRTLSSALNLDFSRIQFTPDLMPSDITGTEIIEEDRETGRRQFKFVRGPVFAHVILADEINRTPPKTQAALLEAMQEHHVTASGETYVLEEPFFVLATQNPIEQEGTYPLPEAQVDRFMLKVVMDYPKKEEEGRILRSNVSAGAYPTTKKVVDAETILKARSVVREVYMDEKIEKYIVDLVYSTRTPQDYRMNDLKDLISFGASPRASISMALAAKTYAFLEHRGYVIPEDVRAVAPDVMRHRIGLTYEAEAENVSVGDVINRVINTVEVP